MIKIELAKFDNLTDIEIINNKQKIIIKGNEYCKVYDNIKNMAYELNNNILSISFDLKIVNIYSQKFINLIKIIYEYNIANLRQMFWLNIKKNIKTINIFNLTECEENLKEKNVICGQFIEIENKCIKIDNKISISDKKLLMENIEILGGIIFDNDNFIDNYNNTLKNSDKLKNIVISHIKPKCETSRKFKFKYDTDIDISDNFTNCRIMLYHPTDILLNKLLNLIHKPKNIWIVISKNININTDYNKYLNILFWKKGCITLCDTIDILMIATSKNENIDRICKINRIKYKLNEDESKIVGNDYNKINLMEKIYIINNFKKQIKLYNTKLCPICQYDIIHKSYNHCGHVFCANCLLENFKYNNACPICRKNVKINNIYLNLNELTKIEYIKKLIGKLEKNGNILIRVDCISYGKGLIKIIKQFLYSLNYNVFLISEYLDRHIKNKNTNNDNMNNIIVYTKEDQFLCQNIKNVKNVILLTNFTKDLIMPQLLGYDYCYNNMSVKIWIYECIL
jgi:hypothetical protein